MYTVILEFTALKTIRSLPNFHGARWSALFRNACNKACIDIEKSILGIYSFRSGTQHIQKGEKINIRLILEENSYAAWQDLFIALCSPSDTEGLFALGRTLELTKVYDELSNIILFEKGTVKVLDLSECSVLHEKFVLEKAYSLYRASHLTIEFISPLRLTLPSTSHKEKGLFIGVNYFRNSNPLSAIVRKIRYMKQTDTSKHVFTSNTIANKLVWVDMKYNESRKIALGGLVGKITFEINIDFDSAVLLCMGEYTGLGKNARFGLGYYSLYI